MPTKEQMETARREIEEAMGQRYVDVLEGISSPGWYARAKEGEPFSELPRRGKVEVLDEVVDWDGFSDGQEFTVIQRAVDGERQDAWMKGIDAVAPDAHLPKRENLARLLETIEQRQETEEEIEYGD